MVKEGRVALILCSAAILAAFEAKSRLEAGATRRALRARLYVDGVPGVGLMAGPLPRANCVILLFVDSPARSE